MTIWVGLQDCRVAGGSVLVGRYQHGYKVEGFFIVLAIFGETLDNSPF